MTLSCKNLLHLTVSGGGATFPDPVDYWYPCFVVTSGMETDGRTAPQDQDLDFPTDHS